MSRLITVAGPLAIAAALTGTAQAQSQAEIAAKLNEEGKELMYGNKFAEASKKFQEAVARVPEAKYFVNLCLARFQEGKFDEALTACNAVELNNPTEAVKAKADKLIDRIHEAAKSQHLELHPGGGGGDPGVDPEHHLDPHPPDPTHADDPGHSTQPAHFTPAVGRPPDQNLALPVTPDNHYTWTLGLDIFGGGGRVGQPDAFGTATTGFRIKGDYLLNPAARLGAQGYIQVNHLKRGRDQMSVAGVSGLDIFDVGVAGYKHVCLGGTPRLCVTPLAGVHLSLMSPTTRNDGAGSQVFNYDAVGARFEVAVTYAFGYRYEHALSLMAGANIYSQVLSSSDAGASPGTPEELGLDKGGGVGYLGLGYTYRFNTPLGSSPFVMLE